MKASGLFCIVLSVGVVAMSADALAGYAMSVPHGAASPRPGVMSQPIPMQRPGAGSRAGNWSRPGYGYSEGWGGRDYCQDNSQWGLRNYGNYHAAWSRGYDNDRGYANRYNNQGLNLGFGAFYYTPGPAGAEPNAGGALAAAVPYSLSGSGLRRGAAGAGGRLERSRDHLHQQGRRAGRFGRGTPDPERRPGAASWRAADDHLRRHAALNRRRPVDLAPVARRSSGRLRRRSQFRRRSA